MIAPKPFKQVCKKCGYSKIISPKSDTDPFGIQSGALIKCPKCNELLQRESQINTFDIFIDSMKNIFR